MAKPGKAGDAPPGGAFIDSGGGRCDYPRLRTALRGLVSGVLGVCLPAASVCGTFLVKLFTGSRGRSTRPRRDLGTYHFVASSAIGTDHHLSHVSARQCRLFLPSRR
jgi:hypothetical protein